MVISIGILPQPTLLCAQNTPGSDPGSVIRFGRGFGYLSAQVATVGFLPSFSKSVGPA